VVDSGDPRRDRRDARVLAPTLMGRAGLLLPSDVAVLGHLGVGHSDRKAQGRRIFPPAKTTRAEPTTGATAIITPFDVAGGDPAVRGGSMQQRAAGPGSAVGRPVLQLHPASRNELTG
jgi:hypothetical protein